MSWETRSGRHYYTRTRRENGNVIREYVGTGPLADAAAYADGVAHRQRQAETIRIQQIRSTIQSAERLTRAFERAVRSDLEGTMAAAGFHRHDRSHWRKRQPGKEMPMTVDRSALHERQESDETDDDPLRANCEDPPFFDEESGIGLPIRFDTPTPHGPTDFPGQEETPKFTSKARSGPNQSQRKASSCTARKAENIWVELLTGGEGGVEVVTEDLHRIRDSLTEADDPPIVRNLIDLYVLAWAKRTYFNLQLQEAMARDQHNGWGNSLQKGADSADRSITTLSKQIVQIRGLLSRASQTASKGLRESVNGRESGLLTPTRTESAKIPVRRNRRR